MSNIIISERNEEGFSAILEAFQSAIKTDVIPMSSFSVEPGDSEKTVQIKAKVHVPAGRRIGVRDEVVDYLDRLIDNGQLDALGVISGTERNPNKEQFDLILRKEGKKSQIIRILIEKEQSGGARGGSDNTTIQEFALAVFLAIRYNRKKDLVFDPKSSKDCLNENDYIYGLSMVDGRGKPAVEKIIELDSSWKRSCVDGANKIYNSVGGKGWRFLRGDSQLDDGSIKKAYLRCKNNPVKTNLSDENKWNPSDIWMVKDGQQSNLASLLDSEGTIDCLNNFLDLAFTDTQYENKSGKNVPAKSLIGISLKKLGEPVNLKVMNPVGKDRLRKAQGIIFNKNATISRLTSFSSIDVYLNYGTGRYQSFQTRNFAGSRKGDWKLELVGEFAAQGKVQGQVARDLMADAGFSNIPEEPKFADCEPNAPASMRNKITNEIYMLLKKYKAQKFDVTKTGEKNMKVQISMKDTSWRYSKLCGLRFLDWMSGLGAGRASRAMKELYLYASSQTDKSSVHFKLF